MKLTDRVALKLGWVPVGRLQASGAGSKALDVLKRELRDWNIKTGKWRDDNGGREIEAIQR